MNLEATVALRQPSLRASCTSSSRSLRLSTCPDFSEQCTTLILLMVQTTACLCDFLVVVVTRAGDIRVRPVEVALRHWA